MNEANKWREAVKYFIKVTIEKAEFEMNRRSLTSTTASITWSTATNEMFRVLVDFGLSLDEKNESLEVEILELTDKASDYWDGMQRLNERVKQMESTLSKFEEAAKELIAIDDYESIDPGIDCILQKLREAMEEK